MQKVLVTGGAGFIGSHICKMLDDLGYYPVVFDDLSTGLKKNAKWGKLYIGNLLNTIDLECVFKENNFKAVIHLAAKTFPRESIDNASQYYSTNVIGTLNLLNTMKKFKVSNLIFSSSCSTYSSNNSEPIPESHNQSPMSPYGRSKYFIERILHDYYIADGIKSISFRFFNAAGACPDLSVGEICTNKDRIIPKIFNSIYDDNISLDIFGNNHPTKDGTSIRDYIHVNDLASAHIAGMNKILTDKIDYDVFNLGSGQGTSILELINACEDITKTKIRFNYVDSNSSELPFLTADISKAKSLLNWSPTHSDLKNIVQTAWDWHLKQRQYT